MVPSNSSLLRTTTLEIWQLPHVSFVWTLQKTVHLVRVACQIVLVDVSIFRVRDLSTLTIWLQRLFSGLLPHSSHFVRTLPGWATAAWFVGCMVSPRSQGRGGAHGAVLPAHLGVAGDVRGMVA